MIQVTRSLAIEEREIHLDVRLLRQAVEKSRARRTTKPSAASRMRRLEVKRRRGQAKQARRPLGPIDD